MFHNFTTPLVGMSMLAATALGAGPDYDRDNPIVTLTQRARSVRLASEADLYVADSLQYLFPLASYGLPSEDPKLAHDGRGSTQEALRAYKLGPFFAVKGLINFGGTPRNFLKIGYSAAGLSGKDQGPLTVEATVNGLARKVAMPFDAAQGCYTVEFWGLAPSHAADLPASAKAAVDGKRILLDPEFLPGNPLDYQPSRARNTWKAGDEKDINHPLRPARIVLTFTTANGKTDGPHTVAFKMVCRGFENFVSDHWGNNPHGGTGSTESILFYNAESTDPDHILREVAPGHPLANGSPATSATTERFFPVKYMMYVRFGPSASIGIHRHKDFMDSFWVTRGSGMGVVADAVPLDGAEPTVELRHLRAFEGMIARPGQMHGLLRDTSEPLEMFAAGAAN
jgi:hypothetical protein